MGTFAMYLVLLVCPISGGGQCTQYQLLTPPGTEYCEEREREYAAEFRQQGQYVNNWQCVQTYTSPD